MQVKSFAASRKEQFQSICRNFLFRKVGKVSRLIRRVDEILQDFSVVRLLRKLANNTVLVSRVRALIACGRREKLAIHAAEPVAGPVIETSKLTVHRGEGAF